MNHECCYDPENDIWVACNVLDSTTSKTHQFVRMEAPDRAFHAWILNERIRLMKPHY